MLRDKLPRWDMGNKRREKRSTAECGVGAHLLWNTVAIHVERFVDAHGPTGTRRAALNSSVSPFPHPQVYIMAELRYSYWRSSQVSRNILCSQGKAVAADQMHRHGANPEPHDTPLLAYGVSRECLSWINKRQNQLPVFLSKVLERQPNTFSTFWTKAYVFNHWVIILLFCGISQTNLHSYGKGRRSILFHFILL